MPYPPPRDRPRLLLLAAGSLIVSSLPPHAYAEWISREEAVMGTRIAVELWSPDRARGERLITRVMDEMRRVDALMSTYKPTSQVSLINARAAHEPVTVDADLFGLLETALDYSRVTEGAFDITYASVGYLYDYRRHIKPSDEALAAALPAVDYRHLRLDPATRSVRFARTGVRIDLGGIAKGWAVDQGIELLRTAGVERAFVTAGGDTRILGDRFGQPWMVGIRDPRAAGKIALRVPLTDAALSTSGDYERFFEADGVRYHHILSPATGRPASAVRSVTVIGPTATRTDGLSKTIFVLGIERGMQVLDRAGDVDAIAIDQDGKIYYSKGLAKPSSLTTNR